MAPDFKFNWSTLLFLCVLLSDTIAHKTTNDLALYTTDFEDDEDSDDSVVTLPIWAVTTVLFIVVIVAVFMVSYLCNKPARPWSIEEHSKQSNVAGDPNHSTVDSLSMQIENGPKGDEPLTLGKAAAMLQVGVMFSPDSPKYQENEGGADTQKETPNQQQAGVESDLFNDSTMKMTKTGSSESSSSHSPNAVSPLMGDAGNVAQSNSLEAPTAGHQTQASASVSGLLMSDDDLAMVEDIMH